MLNVQFAQSIIKEFHKLYIHIYVNNFFQKVIHIKETLFLNKKKLYTNLSTLSTIDIYSCRTIKSMSITKMRFVTYDKTTNIYSKYGTSTNFFNCRTTVFDVENNIKIQQKLPEK